jgi:Pyruvate/2-oxoacid:ferredoxin oxidoreductase delta subunit
MLAQTLQLRLHHRKFNFQDWIEPIRQEGIHYCKFRYAYCSIQGIRNTLIGSQRSIWQLDFEKCKICTICREVKGWMALAEGRCKPTLLSRRAWLDRFRSSRPTGSYPECIISHSNASAGSSNDDGVSPALALLSSNKTACAAGKKTSKATGLRALGKNWGEFGSRIYAGCIIVFTGSWKNGEMISRPLVARKVKFWREKLYWGWYTTSLGVCIISHSNASAGSSNDDGVSPALALLSSNKTACAAGKKTSEATGLCALGKNWGEFGSRIYARCIIVFTGSWKNGEMINRPLEARKVKFWREKLYWGWYTTSLGVALRLPNMRLALWTEQIKDQLHILPSSWTITNKKEAYHHWGWQWSVP